MQIVRLMLLNEDLTAEQLLIGRPVFKYINLTWISLLTFKYLAPREQAALEHATVLKI